MAKKPPPFAAKKGAAKPGEKPLPPWLKKKGK